MNTENKLTAQIAGAYINCPVKVNAASFRANSNSKNDKGETIMSPSILADCHERTFNYSDFTLILCPLSAISDEDAIEVAKIATGWENGNLPPEDVIEWLNEVMTGNCCTFANYVNGREFQELLDFLRSKGYDCGWGKFSSLIEAGIAIDSTTLK